VIPGGYSDWSDFEGRMRRLGFSNDPGAHIARLISPSGDPVDLLCVDGQELGSNEWYGEACRTAIRSDVLGVRVVDPLVFLATKVAAHKSRGRDRYEDKDLEDVVRCLLGWPELADDVETSRLPVARYVRFELRGIATADDGPERFSAAYFGDSRSQDRVRALLARVLRWGRR
jgi:hypothetical protein